MGAAGAVTQAVQALGVIAALPGVEALAADAVVAAGQGDVAGDFLSVAQDRQAPFGRPGQLLLGHGVSSLVGDPECQASLSVSYLGGPAAPPRTRAARWRPRVGPDAGTAPATTRPGGSGTAPPW